MINVWWLLLLIPALLVGHVHGYSKCLRVQRRLSGMVRKLILANNSERALSLLDVAEGVQTKKQQRTFDERLQEMDQ